MVSTRKPLHHGTTRATGHPASQHSLPTNQSSAPSAMVTVAMVHCHRDHGARRAALVGRQRMLAGGVASGAGGPVVERLPGTDHRRGAPGIEPFAATIRPALRAVSAGRKCLASWTLAPGDRFGVWWPRHRGRDGGPGVLA